MKKYSTITGAVIVGISLLIVLAMCIPILAGNHKDTEKADISFHDYVSSYSGYLDQVAMYGTLYDHLDYDGDGKRDRIYRSVSAKDQDIEGCSYRIDFGNGESLEIGSFEDYFTAIELIGYDLTGDGVNEIIYCGLHGASTFPPSGSEMAVFTKTGKGYERMSLPRPREWGTSEENMTGYDVHIKNIEGDKVTLYSTELNYEETVDVQDQLALDYFKDAGTETVSSPAWGVQVKSYKGAPALVQYINIGYKFYMRNLMVYLTWQDGEFKPVHVEWE